MENVFQKCVGTLCNVIGNKADLSISSCHFLQGKHYYPR